MDYYSPPSLLMDLPAGNAGTAATLQVMHAATMAGKTNPAIRHQAVILARIPPPKDYLALASVMQEFVKRAVHYVPDVSGVETVQTADYTLRNRAGDCDDQSVLLASLLESVGQHTRFVAVGFEQGQFSHVYVQVQPTGSSQWYGAETIVDQPLGWNPPGVVNSLYMDNWS